MASAASTRADVALATPAAGREVPVVLRDGTRLATQVRGHGPAVVLCDALGCDGFAWPRLTRALEDRCTVITWHYRGHGNSDPAGDLATLDLETLTDDLEQVLDAHGAAHASLVGYSLGAHVMLNFALRHPARVDRLVSLCGNAGGRLALLKPNGAVAWALAGVLGVHRCLRALAPVGPWLWRKFVGTVVYWLAVRLLVRGNQASPADFRPYFEHLGRMDARLFAHLLERMQTHDIRADLGNIDASTLLVAGGNDVMAPPELSEDMHAKLVDSRLHVLPGASHLLPLERHAEVNRLAAAFLTPSPRSPMP